MNAGTQKPTIQATIVLIIAAATCIATSPEEEFEVVQGEAIIVAAQAIAHQGQFQLSIAPADDAVRLEYVERAVSLRIRLRSVPMNSVERMRWVLSDGPDGDPLGTGSFSPFDIDAVDAAVPDLEAGEELVHADAILGQLCTPDSPDGTPCLPCDAAAGCTLFIHLETCLDLAEIYPQFALVDAVGITTFRVCTVGSAQEQECSALSSWLEITQQSETDTPCIDPDETPDGDDESPEGGANGGG